MKLIIKQRFRDKITGTRYEAGAVVDFAEARAEELLADPRGLVERAKEEEAPAPKRKRPASAKSKKKRGDLNDGC